MKINTSDDSEMTTLSPMIKSILRAMIYSSGIVILFILTLSFLVKEDSPDYPVITYLLIVSCFIFVLSSVSIFVARKTAYDRLLSESEEKYRTLSDKLLSGIFIFQDGVIKYANPKMLRMTGLKIEQIINSPVSDLIHPEDLDSFYERNANDLLTPRSTSHFGFRLKNMKNEYIWCEIAASVIKYSGNQAVLANVIDITEHKKRSERLHVVHKVSQTLVSSVSVRNAHILCLDYSLKLLSANAGAIYTLSSRTVHMICQRGLCENFIKKYASFPVDSHIIGLTCNSRKSFTSSGKSTTELAGLYGGLRDYKDFLIVPIVSEGESLGALMLMFEKENAFYPDDIQAIESITDQLGSFISRELLHKRLEQQHSAIL